jgi:hypothetical protein
VFHGGSSKPGAHVDLSPTELNFEARLGAAAPGPQEVSWTKAGSGFDVQASDPWIAAKAGESGSREHVAVEVRPQGLLAGSYSGSVRIVFHGGKIPPETVAVKLAVSANAGGLTATTGGAASSTGGAGNAAAALQATPASLEFQYKDGDPPPRPKQVAVQGGSFHAESGANWLAVRTAGNTVTVAVDPRNMLVGLHTASLYLRPENGTLMALPVRLTIAASQDFASNAEAPLQFLRWRGSLEPGAVLTIHGATASTGELVAGELPSSRIELTPLGKPGLRVTPPSQANGYSLKIQNAGTDTETSLIVKFRQAR